VNSSIDKQADCIGRPSLTMTVTLQVWKNSTGSNIPHLLILADSSL